MALVLVCMQQRLGEAEPAPLRFVEHQEVPATKRHLQLRTALFQSLELLVGDRAAIGSEQFVYWDPTDPRQCLAPDALVRMNSPNDSFRTWKVWERGAPHLAVEIVSDSDQGELDWNTKFDRYRRLGVEELVRFDPGGRRRAVHLGLSRRPRVTRAFPSPAAVLLAFHPVGDAGAEGGT